ncbi:PKD domain-containing protein, partial [Candidatus Bipolaricaulota bacterium]|nr:PKD domain-containing protein [Candidatus Bipolaricaulota bacterium]
MSRARISWVLSVFTLCLVFLGLTGCTLFQSKVAVDFAASETEGVTPFLVEFTPLVVGEVSAYYWDFGDGETSIDSSPVHVYRDRGTYSVFLTVTLTNGSTGSEKKEDLIDVEEISRKEKRLTPLYWMNRTAGTIHWGDRAGLSSGTIVSYIHRGQDLASGGGYIYWTTEDILYRANYDGTGKEAIATNQKSLYSVSVDHLANKVYWTCLPSPPLTDSQWKGAIKRSNLDGSDVTTLKTYDGDSGTNPFTWWIRSDGNGERYYFSTDDYGYVGPKGVEPKATCDGAFRWTYTYEFTPRLVTGSLCSAYSTALDVSDMPAHYIYWTTGSAINRCKVDGSDTM